MPRPTMDVNGPAYRDLLKQRALYREYKDLYPRMKWALETLDRLDHKSFLTREDQKDLIRARVIRNFVAEEKTREKTGEKAGEKQDPRTTTHYIWRTQGDGKVRPSHAANNGRVFAWSDPPPTGHPGDDHNCRCTAEPFEPEKGLQEYISQTVTFAAVDEGRAWEWNDFALHYIFGKGKAVTLHEIGLLGKVIDHAKAHNQTHLEGGGSLFQRVERQIFTEARQHGAGNFSTSFRGGEYSFHDIAWPLGNLPIRGTMQASVTEKGKYLAITATVEYMVEDYFIVDKDNNRDQISIVDLIGATPFYIRDQWSTRIKATIKKDSGESIFPSRSY